MFFAFLVHFRMACCRCLNDDCFRLPGEPQPFCTINISKSKSFISNIFTKLRKKKQHQTNIQFANLCAKWPEIELELAKKRDRQRRRIFAFSFFHRSFMKRSRKQRMGFYRFYGSEPQQWKYFLVRFSKKYPETTRDTKIKYEVPNFSKLHLGVQQRN